MANLQPSAASTSSPKNTRLNAEELNKLSRQVRKARAARHASDPPPFPQENRPDDFEIIGADHVNELGRRIAELTSVVSRLGVTDRKQPSPNPMPLATNNKKSRGKHIGAKMLKLLSENRAAAGWSSAEWAARLNCAESTVRETRAWKETLKATRTLAAVERAKKMDRSQQVKRGRKLPDEEEGET